MAEPRHHTPRSDLPTHGWRAAKVAQAKGRPFMPWQRDAVDVALEYDPDTGLYRYGIVVVIVQRQAGKTDLEGSVADQHCLWNRRQFVRITMQDGKTADEWMREQHFPSLEEAPIFRGRYRESRRAGAHGPHWTRSRSSFTTFPPTRKSLHSKQSDKVFVDEAWVHDAETGRELRQAIRPTMNSRPNAQLWVVSTLGDLNSVYLDEYVARGKASLGDPNTRVCFIDYGIPDDADAEDLDVIAAHHPAFGRTLSLPSLRDSYEEFRNAETGILDVAGWARAYGNRSSIVREQHFPDGVWTDAGAPRPPIPDRVGLALDATPDGEAWAVGAGWRDTRGHGWVEVIDDGTVDRDTPARVARIAKARGVPLHVAREAQGALAIVDGFTRLDPADQPEVVFVNQAQSGSACVTFSRGIFNNTVHHTNDDALDAAAKIVTTRPLPEGGFTWTRRVPGNIAPVVACTLGLRAFELLPAPPRRPVAYA